MGSEEVNTDVLSASFVIIRIVLNVTIVNYDE